ncbi:MAG: translation initiation factor IF-2 [Clostridiales bacterium]|jgi:translation initiation factor IF-2|nr:translation initiation factor IF-2 [Eubacteriales bacterium]MDH7564909.1 translation initiation factor IF-2 [Clostridiales bacterium]
MEKYRIYELAKELNTTSKRLMEKLAEINIVVKNHMSLLNEDELNALYNHIGIIRHDDSQKPEQEEKKPAVSMQPKAEQKKEGAKDVKHSPRIIRTTEIVIDTKNESNGVNTAVRSDSPNNEARGERGNLRNNQRHDLVKVAEANAGLRFGYVRDDRNDYRRDAHGTVKQEPKNEPVKESAKVETKHGSVNADTQKKENISHNEVKQKIRHETKTEFKHDDKQNLKNGTAVDSTVQTRQAARPGDTQTPKMATEKVEDKGVPKMEANIVNKPSNPAEQMKNRPSFKQHTGIRHEQGMESGRKTEHEQKAAGGFKGPNEQRQAGRPVANEQAQGSNRGTNDRNQGGSRGPGERTNSGSFANRQGQRPAGDRSKEGFRSGGKSLEIPKPELSEAQKEALNSQRTEVRREFQNKDVDKDVKREQKKDVVKAQPAEKGKKFKPQKLLVGVKKGITEALSEDYILDEFYDDDGAKRTRKAVKPKKDTKAEHSAKHIPQRAVLTSITIPETISVKELAEALKKTATEVIKKLMGLGVMATLNHELDFETSAIVAEEFGVKAEKEVVVNEEDILFDDSEDKEEELEPRPPVVVVMGHVDHGKTSLLDAIRKTHVIDSEAGGITQHIGAYMVKINNRNITFLDTPGHEAFTAMRARGAQVTDIAILVVAADDGVMPQTVEAINHAKAANVSIIVAINKIDKPGANPERVKQELTEYGLVPEEWGGDVICVPISAKKHENIDHLLEMVLLTADILELKANPNRQAKGTVIEAKLDKDRGPLATILVQRGTLNTGDSIVTGTTVGRIRAMTDDKGHKIKKAGPSTPVEILGLPEVPEAGEIFYAIEDEKVAKHLAEKRKQKQKEQNLKATAKVSLDDLFNQIKEGKVKDLNIIVKADVQGSVEAVKQSLEKLSNEEVRIKIIHDGVGAVTESDVTLAEVSNAIIIGFNVRPTTNVMEAAKSAGVDIRLYRVIYNAIEDIKAAMKGMLEPTFKEVVQGHTEVRQIFKVSGVGTIGGGYVIDGKISRNSDIRVVRNGIVIHEGKLASLKRFKDDAKEVVQGYECGLSVEKFNDIKEGDVIESYVMEEIVR